MPQHPVGIPLPAHGGEAVSLFSGPEEHAANPPSTWQVTKLADRAWAITLKTGEQFSSAYPTRRQAQEAIDTGFYPDLYDKEERWYAGENIAGWKPYAELSKSVIHSGSQPRA